MELAKVSQFERPIRQANALTTAAYRLSKNEKRLVYVAIEQVLSSKDEINFAALPYGQYLVEIDNSTFAQRFKLDKSHATRTLKQAAQNLQRSSVTIYVPDEDSEDGEKGLDAISWTTKTSIKPKRGKTIISFNAELMEMITKVDSNFTKYLVSEAGSLSSEWSMRLFESLSQYKGLGKAVFKASWMMTRYGVPASYFKMNEFRKNVLIPAVKEIASKQDFKYLKYEEEKKNGESFITFTWQLKKKAASVDTDKSKTSLEIAVQTYMHLNSDNLDLISKEHLEHLKSEWVNLVIDGFEMDLIAQKFKSMLEVVTK